METITLIATVIVILLIATTGIPILSNISILILSITSILEVTLKLILSNILAMNIIYFDFDKKMFGLFQETKQKGPICRKIQEAKISIYLFEVVESIYLPLVLHVGTAGAIVIRCIEQSINQRTNLIDQSIIDRPINQPINRPTNQSGNQLYIYILINQ